MMHLIFGKNKRAKQKAKMHIPTIGALAKAWIPPKRPKDQTEASGSKQPHKEKVTTNTLFTQKKGMGQK